MTLQERLDGAAMNGLGFLVSGAEAAVNTKDWDCRLYGESSPWWGPSQVARVEVGQGRVILERLTVGHLWWRSGYLGAIRDVLVTDRGCLIGPGATDPPTTWPSAVEVSGLHVRGGALIVAAANVVWTGGSVERTTGALEIGRHRDTGPTMVQGVRFEHDVERTLTIYGPEVVTLVGCHFVLTNVVFDRTAHRDSKMIGCGHVMSSVTDQRRSRAWYQW